MTGTVLRIFLLLAIAYAVVLLLAWVFQNRLAFPGPSSPRSSPSDVGISEGETVRMVTEDDVTLHGWFIPSNPSESPGPWVIWFYGNMETVHDLRSTIRWLRDSSTALLIVDYRGYGASEGQATEPGLYLDAEAAWTFMTKRPDIDAARVGVYGRSLGSAVALYLATNRPVRALALDSPFSTGRDMARTHYPFVPGGLLRLELDNLSRARQLTIPLLVFHGTADIIAPIAMGEAIAAAGHAEELVRIDDAGHNDTYVLGGDAYRDRLHAFWRNYLKGDSTPRRRRE